MDISAIRAALERTRAVMSAGRYDPTDAYAAVRRLKALAPPHVGPIALKAEVAVMTSIEYRSTDNDALARYAVTKLISAMEHAHLRVVD